MRRMLVCHPLDPPFSRPLNKNIRLSIDSSFPIDFEDLEFEIVQFVSVVSNLLSDVGMWQLALISSHVAEKLTLEPTLYLSKVTKYC